MYNVYLHRKWHYKCKHQIKNYYNSTGKGVPNKDNIGIKRAKFPKVLKTESIGIVTLLDVEGKIESIDKKTLFWVWRAGIQQEQVNKKELGTVGQGDGWWLVFDIKALTRCCHVLLGGLGGN